MRITSETKAATRQRILEVAKKLFASQGFGPTTTRDIARESQIAAGTLFNYFSAKESIALALVAEACKEAAPACEQGAAAMASDGGCRSRTAIVNGREVEPLTIEEELFAQVTAILRKLKPHRKYLGVVLETLLSPAASESSAEPTALRSAHLETVAQIAARHGLYEALTPVALQLYWTLYTGALAFWTTDKSPKQEDTLALLDESLAMFVGWLNARSDSTSEQPPTTKG